MINIFRYFYYNFYRPKIFFPKKTYSMYGEDLFVKSFFKNKKNGIYLDVEDSELNVQKSIDFKKYKPTLICVEIHNHKEMYNQNTDYIKSNPVNKLLLKRKYSIVWNNGFSYIYALKKIISTS